MLGELLLSAYMFVASPDSSAINPANDSTYIKPIVYTDTLKVNTENKIRYASKKSELEGIIDLKYHAENSLYEDAWAFIPEDTTWYEIGIDESGWIYNTKSGIYNSVSIDSAFFKYLRDKHDEINIYHIHPLKNIYSMLLPLNNMLITSKTSSTIPSSMDIMTMHSYNDLNHKLVSSMGVTEYGLTDKGKTVPDTVLSYYINRQINNIILLHDTTARTIEETALKTIHNTLSQWDNEAVWIEFTPFRRLLFKEK